MRNPGDPEHAARVRAARAYAGLEQKVIAQALDGMSIGTYKRIEQGTRPVSKPERAKVANVCGVPLDFMEDGFDALLVVSDDVLARRVLEELRALRRDIEAQLPTSRRLMDAVANARAALEIACDSAGNSARR